MELYNYFTSGWVNDVKRKRIQIDKMVSRSVSDETFDCTHDQPTTAKKCKPVGYWLSPWEWHYWTKFKSTWWTASVSGETRDLLGKRPITLVAWTQVFQIVEVDKEISHNSCNISSIGQECIIPTSGLFKSSEKKTILILIDLIAVLSAICFRKEYTVSYTAKYELQKAYSYFASNFVGSIEHSRIKNWHT